MKYLIIIVTLLCLASNAYSQPMYCGHKRTVSIGDSMDYVSTFCGGPDEVINYGEYVVWIYMIREAASTYGASYSIIIYFDRGRIISIERG